MCQGKFYYFGLESCIGQACSVFDLKITTSLHVQVNCDGLPLYKSSAIGFWPILCRVRAGHVFSDVFLVGLFCGKGKPSSCDQFQKQFIIECQALSGSLTLGETKCSFDIECFTCDTPARAF